MVKLKNPERTYPSISFLLMGFLLTVTMAQAQPTPSTVNVTWPQHPDVAPLLRFAEVPVSNFNGTADVSVPLYTIKSGDLTYPITINYHTGGIRVADEASLVGLNWSLSTVAVLAETNPSAAPNIGAPAIVPDEFAVSPSKAPPGAMNNIYTGESFMNTLGQCTNYPAFSSSLSPNFEPDLYILSANGISGKFFVPNGSLDTWVNAGASNIQISGQIPQYCYLCTPLTATMPDGSQYLFKDVGITTTSSVSASSSVPPSISYTHTFYLSQIISPIGKTITFKYLSSLAVPQTQLQQGFSESWAYDDAPGAVNFLASSGSSLSQSSVIDNKYLDTIYFDNGYAKYFYSTRLDMAGYKLDSIDIFRQGQSLAVRTIAFQYGYYGSFKGNYGDYITDAQFLGPSVINGPPEQYRAQRLKLLSVRIDQDPPYTFEYENSPLPYKTSFAQDLWGYFNGNLAKTLIPDYNNLGYLDDNVPPQLFLLGKPFVFANRAAHLPYTRAGILEQINYPTGGYTTFQYEPNTFNLPNNGTAITDTVVSLSDWGVGEQSAIFTVPDVGETMLYPDGTSSAVNPVNISVILICGGDGSCTSQSYSGGCESYVQTDSANGLYAFLQKWDPAFNEWDPPQLQNVFDNRNGNLNISGSGPCQANSFLEPLPPGTYRMVCNFPDNRPGNPGGPFASISMDFKVRHQIVYPNQGGGLRIHAVTDYAAGGQIAERRQYHYSTGKLMTKPIFYRFNQGIRTALRSGSCTPFVQTAGVWGLPMPQGCLPADPPPPPVNYNRTFLIVYNNPLIPYSFSANGSPVGYDSVTVSRVDAQGNDQGRSIYLYNASPDSYNFYGSNLPGIPGTPDLTNGELLQQIEQKRINQAYTTIRSTSYSYSVGSPATYFGFKYEYMPNYRTDGSTEFTCPDPLSQFLHLYPILTGHLNKTSETTVDSAAGIGMTTFKAYTYNPLNQVSSESMIKSNGKTMTHYTYYPGDYTSTGDFTSTMRSLNMLNYPIEKYTSVNNLATEGTYTQYLAHDNIVTPSQTYSLDAPQPVGIVASVPGNNRDSHYAPRANFTFDANGNQILFQKTNGQSINYLWDYNHSLPVAEIANAAPNDYAYTSFEADGKGNWVYSGPPVADPTTPAGSSSYLLSNGAISKSILNPAETYVVSYWTNNPSSYILSGTLAGYPILVRSYNGWKFYMHKLTGQSSLVISGGGSIDDLRLYPDNAQMQTSIYDPLFGATSLTDLNGKATYYNYDADMRLKNIRDLNGNVIKDFQYGYIGFDQNNNHTIYYSAAINTSVSANNCNPGFRFSVPYSVPFGTYTSFISQADADAQAQNDVATQGQDLANQSGPCSPAPCVAPTISSVTASGNTYSITYSGLVGQVAFLLITDGTTSNTMIPITLNPALSSNTYVGTIPATGKTYFFQIMVEGQICPSTLSNQVSAQF